MNDRFDKLIPGRQNKVHFLVDLAFAAMATHLAMPEDYRGGHFTALWVAAVIPWTFASVLLRLYSPQTPRRLIDNLLLRFLSVLASTLSFVVLARLAPTIDADEINPELFVVFFFLCGAVGRLLVFKPVQSLSRPMGKVLIIGTGAKGRTTYMNLTRAAPGRQIRVGGFLRIPGEADRLEGAQEPILGDVGTLQDILADNWFSEVYLAAKVTDYAEIFQEAVRVLERAGMPFAVPLHQFEFERATLLSSSPARDGYLHYMSTAYKPIQYAAKRLFDILASATALLILSPLLIGVAIAIKVTSQGPVMFKQKRVGLHGTAFELLKFRSMVINAEELKASLMTVNEQSGPVFKMANDPRITGIGAFIRKYSIDELPQLINILRGDMAVVGPRPAVPKEVVEYKAWQRRRLSVRPGLTCYWQVGGRNSIGFEDWMRLDLKYVDKWSLGVDFSLILQTFPAVLAGKGAS